MLALGVRRYFRSSFNVFDVVIVLGIGCRRPHGRGHRPLRHPIVEAFAHLQSDASLDVAAKSRYLIGQFNSLYRLAFVPLVHHDLCLVGDAVVWRKVPL